MQQPCWQVSAHIMSAIKLRTSVSHLPISITMSLNSIFQKRESDFYVGSNELRQ